MPALGLAAAVTAWRAGGTSPKNIGAFVALIIGVLAILVFGDGRDEQAIAADVLERAAVAGFGQ